jgi:hypothetical protein
MSPDTVGRNLAGDIAGIQQSVRDLEEDLLVFEDIRTLKSWLKSVKRQRAAPHFDEMPF